jgi:hypothetical protein
MEAIKTFRNKKDENVFLYIYPDEEPQDPRENDNTGKMICFHREYDLGDAKTVKPEQFEDMQELYDYIKKELHGVVILPLYLYDHSGLRMKIGSFSGLLPQGHAQFDTMVVGYIYIDKDMMKLEHLTKKKAEKRLHQEVELYDKYLAGWVYGFRKIKKVVCKECKHESEEDIDSCWGFYSEDEIFDCAGEKKKDWVEVEK